MAPKVMPMKPNGIAIKEFRESRHIGSRELARRASISHQFLVRIQQGRRGASQETIEAIAEALGVSIASITLPEPVGSPR
jgi:transcriptional regulator with XRE-family HTH domain